MVGGSATEDRKQKELCSSGRVDLFPPEDLVPIPPEDLVPIPPEDLVAWNTTSHAVPIHYLGGLTTFPGWAKYCASFGATPLQGQKRHDAYRRGMISQILPRKLASLHMVLMRRGMHGEVCRKILESVG